MAKTTIPQSMWNDIAMHAGAEWPRECCGLVSGVEGRLQTVHRMTNAAPTHDRYALDDEEFLRVYREIERRGEELIAIYHSHPNGPAYPSNTDVDFASWPGALYLICSLEDRAAPVIRAFTLDNATISEVPLIVVDAD